MEPADRVDARSVGESSSLQPLGDTAAPAPLMRWCLGTFCCETKEEAARVSCLGGLAWCDGASPFPLWALLLPPPVSPEGTGLSFAK